MKITQMEPMIRSDEQKCAINPFLQDSYNMGQYVGTNVAVMMGNHENEHCPYLIVIDRLTGERIRISF